MDRFIPPLLFLLIILGAVWIVVEAVTDTVVHWNDVCVQKHQEESFFWGSMTLGNQSIYYPVPYTITVCDKWEPENGRLSKP